MITDYKSFSRPPLPRNKYNHVEDKVSKGGGTSLFSGTGVAGTNDAVPVINDFVGSTETEDGIRGLVPAPSAHLDDPLLPLNDNVRFLKGNGTWTDIPISRYTEENTDKDGIKLTGNLSVTDTISTQTLNVTGSAHFWELVIDKVRSAGGNLLITPGTFIVDAIDPDVITYTVDDTQEPFLSMFYNESAGTGIDGLKDIFTACNITALYAKRVYQKKDDHVNEISNEIVVGDMIRCKTFNVESGGVANNKDYWSFVLGTGMTQHEIDGSTADCNYIDLFYTFTAGANSYGIGTKCKDDGTIVSGSHDFVLHAVNSETQNRIISRIVTLNSDELQNGEYEVNEDVTISENTVSPVKLIKSDGTVINKGDTISSGSVIDKGTIVVFEDGDDLDTISQDIAVENGEIQAEEITYQKSTNTVRGGETQYAITEFTFGYGEMDIEVRDNLIVLGHLWNGERQDAILISAYDPLDTEVKAPAICQYKGIRKFETLSQFRTNQLASNGNVFTGRFMVDYNGYLVDVNERLNLFYTDIQTGLETVGIHLDGDHSTIKLVGSVEIRQNGDGTTDTLTVWDEDGEMRVRISPDAIPAKSNMASEVSPTYKATFNTLSGQRPADESTVIQHHTWTEFIWSWNHQWKYYTQGNYFKFKTITNLGTLNNGEHITVTGVNANIISYAYFKDSVYVQNRGTNQQSISSVILRLKRGTTSSSTTIASVNLTSGATLVVNDESASIVYNASIWDNRQITTTGNYFLELEVQYNVYAEITYTSEQKNFYFSFYYSMTGYTNITKPTTSLTRIGRNGIVFNGEGANQWFYSGITGMEMRWGDALVSLDSTYGLKTNGITQTLTSGYISSSATFVKCDGATSANNIYLPSALTYGVGRIITVLGNDYITIRTYSNSQKIYRPMSEEKEYGSYPSVRTTSVVEVTSLTMSDTYTSYVDDGDGGTTTIYHRTHRPIMMFMCTGTGWLLLNI